MGKVTPMTLLVTGAGGFLGRAVVQAALARGHTVRALTRHPIETRKDPPGLTCVAADLAVDNAGLDPLLHGVDAVIHAAAALAGDEALMMRDTVGATRNLLAALGDSHVAPRLVLVSSIGVYDASAPGEMAEVTENTPLEADPSGRDAYTRAKLAQEAALDAAGYPAWVARPGAIYGPGRVWNAHLGPRIGPMLIRLGNAGEIPLIELGSCARALVAMAETPLPGGTTRAVNLVDSDLPDRPRFLLAMGAAAPRIVLPVSWRLFDRAAGVLARLAHLARLARLDSLPRVPGLLRRPALRARMRPLRYSNARARAELNWAPTPHFETALRAALEASK